jgi:hypothetical protein
MGYFWCGYFSIECLYSMYLDRTQIAVPMASTRCQSLDIVSGLYSEKQRLIQPELFWARDRLHAVSFFFFSIDIVFRTLRHGVSRNIHFLVFYDISNLQVYILFFFFNSAPSFNSLRLHWIKTIWWRIIIRLVFNWSVPSDQYWSRRGEETTDKEPYIKKVTHQKRLMALKYKNQKVFFPPLTCCAVLLFSRFNLNQDFYGPPLESLHVKKVKSSNTIWRVKISLLTNQDLNMTACHNLMHSYIFHVVITQSLIFYVTTTHDAGKVGSRTYSAGQKKLASSWMQKMLLPKNNNLFQ